MRGYVHEVVIACGAEVIARHIRSWEKEDYIYDPLHYLALIEQKTNALDQATPLADWELQREYHRSGKQRAPARPISPSALGWRRVRKAWPSASSPHQRWCTNSSKPRMRSALLRLQKQLSKYSLLIIDELGYVPLSPTGAELLFEVFSQRYERGSTIVTSQPAVR